MTTTLTALTQPVTFWELPEVEQETIANRLPKQDTWVLNVIRNDEGYWYFDLPEYGIYNELLVGGTQLALDWHYLDWALQNAFPCDLDAAEIEMVVSSKPIEDCTTVLTFLQKDEDDPDASYYLDTRSNLECWLCPMLLYMFKDIPETLYLDLHPETWLDEIV